MKDERIDRLIEEMGLKGFGVYVLLRLMVECSDDGIADLGALVRSANAYASRRLIMRVLTDYDLFDVEGSRVRVCVDGREPGRTDTPADTLADTPADVHFPLSGKLEIYTSSSKEKEVVEEEGKAEEKVAGADGGVSAVWTWLQDDRNQPWREAVLMHSGYAELLRKHWNEAVGYFISHVTAQDQQDHVMTVHDTRVYFANFSKLSTASGRSLKQYLEQLEQKTLTNEQIRKALGYE